MLLKFLLSLSLSFLFFPSLQSESKPSAYPLPDHAKVVGITDGDTFKLLKGTEQITVRLEHIDCPEKGQPFSANAKQFASDLCFGKMVEIRSNGKKDRYRRLIAEIYVNGVCVNEELVRNGFAWHFVQYSKSEKYSKLEKEARKDSIGLWADKNASPPWDWRKKKKKQTR